MEQAVLVPFHLLKDHQLAFIYVELPGAFHLM